MKLTRFISHRGANTDAVENTMEAFKIAHEYGFKLIELDVQMSADGKLFLFHDKTLTRLSNCCTDSVTNMTLEELQNIALIHADIIGKYNIPSFDEYLDWMLTNDIETNVEIKVTKCCKKYEDELAFKVLETLDKYPSLRKRVFISSFSDIVMKVLNTKPKYKRSKLLDITNWKKEFNRIDIEVYKEFIDNSYDAIIVNYDCLTKKKFDYLKEKFGIVFVYSVKTDEQVKKLLKLGVDSMFVDRKEYFDIKL